MSAPIRVVDENDQPLRSGTKQEAWAGALWHRVVRIMLDDGQNNLLLQHRSPAKDIYPNCWDNSAAGHVDAGEDYLAAAYRELQEELGLTGVELRQVGAFIDNHDHAGNKYRRFVRVYAATLPAGATPVSNEPDKIDDVRWFPVDDVKRLVSQHPDQASDGLSQVVARFY